MSMSNIQIFFSETRSIFSRGGGAAFWCVGFGWHTIERFDRNLIFHLRASGLCSGFPIFFSFDFFIASFSFHLVQLTLPQMKDQLESAGLQVDQVFVISPFPFPKHLILLLLFGRIVHS